MLYIYICLYIYRYIYSYIHIHIQETADLVTLTEEIVNGKLHFLCSEETIQSKYYLNKNHETKHIVYLSNQFLEHFFFSWCFPL